jgi:hypothetical protein
LSASNTIANRAAELSPAGVRWVDEPHAPRSGRGGGGMGQCPGE